MCIFTLTTHLNGTSRISSAQQPHAASSYQTGWAAQMEKKIQSPTLKGPNDLGPANLLSPSVERHWRPPRGPFGLRGFAGPSLCRRGFSPQILARLMPYCPPERPPHRSGSHDTAPRYFSHVIALPEITLLVSCLSRPPSLQNESP